MCSCDFAEAPACCVVRQVRARLEHTCYECGATIVPGETYEVASGIWDGHPRRFKTCLTCVAWKDAYVAEMASGERCEPPYGDLIECLLEHQANLHPREIHATPTFP